MLLRLEPSLLQDKRSTKCCSKFTPGHWKPFEELHFYFEIRAGFWSQLRHGEPRDVLWKPIPLFTHSFSGRNWELSVSSRGFLFYHYQETKCWDLNSKCCCTIFWYLFSMPACFIIWHIVDSRFPVNCDYGHKISHQGSLTLDWQRKKNRTELSHSHFKRRWPCTWDTTQFCTLHHKCPPDYSCLAGKSEYRARGEIHGNSFTISP